MRKRSCDERNATSQCHSVFRMLVDERRVVSDSDAVRSGGVALAERGMSPDDVVEKEL